MAMQTDAVLAREFRTWFRDQLRREDLTQAEAAVALETHPSTVVKWCSKQPPLPSYVQLVRIAATFRGLPPSLARSLPMSARGGIGA
jgi:hypothetical protein